MHRNAVLTSSLVLLAVLAALWLLGVFASAPPAPPLGSTQQAGPEATTAADAAASTPLTREPDGDAVDADGRRSLSTVTDPYARFRTGYRGRVVTARGAPVPGITVRLFRGSPDLVLLEGFDPFARRPADPQLEAARAPTAADGTFELAGVAAAGMCWARLEWPEVDRAPQALRSGHGTTVPVQATPRPGEVSDLGDLVLKVGGTLVGRVVDDAGAPLAGALVRAAVLPPLPLTIVPIERLDQDSLVLAVTGGFQLAAAMPAWFDRVVDALPIAHTRSDGDGTFTLYGVDPGKATVAVTLPGRASLLRQDVLVEAGATHGLGDLVLGEGEYAEVLVTDGEDTPAAGAEVVVAPLSMGVPLHIGAPIGRTDQAGRATATGLPRGRAIAAARQGPDRPWTIGEPGPATGPLRVALPARYSLVLTVKGPDGTPPRDVQLRLFRGVLGRGAIETAMFGMGAGLDLRQRMQRREDGAFVLDGLDAGPWTIAAHAEGCAAKAEDLDLAGDRELTLQLAVARTLAVRVLDGAGQPLADAALLVQSLGGGREQRLVDMPLCVGHTGADGRFTIRSLPTERTRLSARHPACGQVHAEVDDRPPTELVLQFAAAGRITGRLTDGGRVPQPGRWVAVLERRYDAGRPRGASPELPQLALPDLDGEFEFGALQPGRYRITAQDSVTDVSTTLGLYQYMQRRRQIHPWNKAEVDLGPGEVAQVQLDALLDSEDFQGPGAAVRGTVTLDGAPATGALVVGTSQKPERRALSRVDRGGAFDLGHCPAGGLRVVVVPQDVVESRLRDNLFSHHFAQNHQLVAGQPLDLQIAITTGSITGTVHDWNGDPVDDARVMLAAKAGEGSPTALRWARTDARGVFRLTQLPAGDYAARVDKPGTGRAELSGLAVRAGVETAAPSITLRATARVRGRVDRGGLEDGGDVTVIFEAAADGGVHRARTRRGDRFSFDDLEAGSYRAFVEHQGARLPAGDVLVTAPEMGEVVLQPRR